MYKIPNRYIHYNMEGATLWLKIWQISAVHCSSRYRSRSCLLLYATKNSLLMESTDADDDYDDFHEDLDESTEFSRNYVPLNASVPASAPTEETAETEASSSSSDFTPLSGQAADLSGEEGETVEDVEEFSMKKMPRTKSLP